MLKEQNSGVQDTMQEPKCYLCGETQTIVEYHNQTRDGTESLPYKCMNCHLVFLYPQFPIKGKYIEYYQEHYDDARTPEMAFNEGLNEAIERVTRLNPLIKDKQILEIGCGAGSFLSIADKFTRLSYGIELHNERAKYAHRMANCSRVFSDIDTMEKLARPEQKFDTIFMFHVLEHTQYPIDELTCIINLLKDDGVLVVEVPNIDDLLLSLSPEFMDFYFQYPHNFYFSADTLKKVLKRAGFCWSPVRPLQRYGLDNHFKWILGDQRMDTYLSESSDFYKNDLEKTFQTDTLLAMVGKDKHGSTDRK